MQKRKPMDFTLQGPWWSPRRPTQLNLSPIGARNQRKFTPNPSPIWIRIPAGTPISISSITFGSDVQSRWFKMGWKANLKGYNFLVYQKYDSEVKLAENVG